MMMRRFWLVLCLCAATWGQDQVKPLMGELPDWSQVPPGCVGWWLFQEGAGPLTQDLTGYSTPAVMTATTWSAGLMGSCPNFDGANSTIVAADNMGSTINHGLTITAWIMPRTIGETAGRVVDKSEAATGTNGFHFGMTTGNKLVLRVHSAVPGVNSSENSVPYGVWTHVAATVGTGGGVVFYINGRLDLAPGSVGALSLITTGNAFTIGNRSGTADRTFDGLIDDVRVWDAVLTGPQIASVYGDPFAAFDAAPVLASASGVKGNIFRSPIFHSPVLGALAPPLGIVTFLTLCFGWIRRRNAR